MIWHRVSRAQLEAAENLRQAAVQQLAASEVLRQQLALSLEEMRLMLAAQKDESEQERRRLMDRIFRLSGQPPLYEAPAAAAPETAAPKEPDPKALARMMPTARMTFAGVHKAAQDAMASGNFDVDKARVRA